MKRRLLTSKNLALLAFSGMMSSSYAQTITDSLTFTGGIQTYTVPCGVTELTITTYGAQGGSGAAGGNASVGGAGGLGSMATGTLTVTPGDILNIFVGGQGGTPTGGFNGGGNGGSTNAGGGGGATDVRINGTALTDRILVGGGGGGGGRAGCETSPSINGGNGGNGGQNGFAGIDSPTSGGVAGGGFPGVGTTGGAAGIGCGGFLGSAGGAGTLGQGGNGGAGQSCCCFSQGSIPGGGGGGGGFDGGGAGGGGSAGTAGCSGNDKGGGAGGAGGSNSTVGVASGSTTNGVRTGNGAVYITYDDPTPVVTFSQAPTTICSGDTVLFTVNGTFNPTSYNWTVYGAATILSGQGTNSVYVTATSDTVTLVVEATNGCNTGPQSWAYFIVHNLPTVDALAVDDELCAGESTDITGSGASSYTWSNGAMTATTNVSPTSTTVYTVTGTDSYGCSNDANVTITVNPLPMVSVSAPMSGTVCGGQDIQLTGTPAGGMFGVVSGDTTALSGSVFNASNTGLTVIGYYYTDGNGCSAVDTIQFNVNCFLGLDLLSNNGMVSIYPNPAQGSFSLKSAVSITGKVELIDENGRVVLVQEVSNMKQKQFDLKNVTPGVYNLRITNGTEIITGKLSVVK